MTSPTSETQPGATAETRARMAELLERASNMLIDDGIPVERCALSKTLVLEAASVIRSAQAEVTRLRSLLDLPADCGLKTGNAPEITGKGIVWLKDYDELRADRHRMRAVVDAARKLATEGRYIAGMADDNPFKGNGNRLADALAALDAAEGKRT